MRVRVKSGSRNLTSNWDGDILRKKALFKAQIPCNKAYSSMDIVLGLLNSRINWGIIISNGMYQICKITAITSVTYLTLLRPASPLAWL